MKTKKFTTAVVLTIVCSCLISCDSCRNSTNNVNFKKSDEKTEPNYETDGNTIENRNSDSTKNNRVDSMR